MLAGDHLDRAEPDNPKKGLSYMRRTVVPLLAALAFALGGLALAAPGGAVTGHASASQASDSVRITAGCDETDREHIMCNVR
jgi:hypothetical protein